MNTPPYCELHDTEHHEYLHGLVKWNAAEADRLTKLVDELNDEITRLKKWGPENANKVIDQKNTEIEHLQNELRETRSLLYRATAPTASLQEAQDREAAIREGYERTKPL